jgi:hypothetical protein
MFCIYKKVGDSGDLVTQIRRFTIVDTSAPAIAMPLSLGLHLHRRQKFPVGHHQGARQLAVSLQ